MRIFGYKQYHGSHHNPWDLIYVAQAAVLATVGEVVCTVPGMLFLEYIVASDIRSQRGNEMICMPDHADVSGGASGEARTARLSRIR